MKTPIDAIIDALEILIQPGETTTGELAQAIVEKLEAAGYVILPRVHVSAQAWREK